MRNFVSSFVIGFVVFAAACGGVEETQDLYCETSEVIAKVSSEDRVYHPADVIEIDVDMWVCFYSAEVDALSFKYDGGRQVFDWIRVIRGDRQWSSVPTDDSGYTTANGIPALLAKLHPFRLKAKFQVAPTAPVGDYHITLEPKELDAVLGYHSKDNAYWRFRGSPAVRITVAN